MFVALGSPASLADEGGVRTGRDVKVFPIKLKVSSWGQLENWAQEFFARSAVIPGYSPKKHGFETWVNNLYFYELHQIYPPYDEFWLERLTKANYDPFWWRKAAPVLLASHADRNSRSFSACCILALSVWRPQPGVRRLRGLGWCFPSVASALGNFLSG
jgi:hypothetical protein